MVPLVPAQAGLQAVANTFSFRSAVVPPVADNTYPIFHSLLTWDSRQLVQRISFLFSLQKLFTPANALCARADAPAPSAPGGRAAAVGHRAFWDAVTARPAPEQPFTGGRPQGGQCAVASAVPGTVSEPAVSRADPILPARATTAPRCGCAATQGDTPSHAVAVCARGLCPLARR